jgi:hypothetical protein
MNDRGLHMALKAYLSTVGHRVDAQSRGWRRLARGAFIR